MVITRNHSRESDDMNTSTHLITRTAPLALTASLLSATLLATTLLLGPLSGTAHAAGPGAQMIVNPPPEDS